MSEIPPISYSDLIDQSMRGVIRNVLRQVEEHGLPEEHHFYITFLTEHPGVAVSDTLKSRYPNEMTIVLQHQFWDFKVEDHKFEVALSFGGVPEHLVVPYTALVAFADPSVKFGLQFQTMETSDETLLYRLTMNKCFRAIAIWNLPAAMISIALQKLSRWILFVRNSIRSAVNPSVD